MADIAVVTSIVSLCRCAPASVTESSDGNATKLLLR